MATPDATKPTRLRVLHVVPSYLPATRYGGPIYSVHGLCKALARAGHDVRVFTTDIDGPSSSNVPLATPVDVDGVQVTYFPCRRLRRIVWAPDMRPALERAMPDTSVVHLHSLFLWPTLAAARAATHARVPYVVAPRGSLVPHLIRRRGRAAKLLWLAFFERSTIEAAARLHFTSRAEFESASQMRIALPSPCIVPNGVDLPDPQPPHPPSAELEEAMDGAPYCVFLGRLSWEKGLDRLFTALAGTDLRLLVAGTAEGAYAAELTNIVRAQDLSSQVTFLGQVAGPDKWALLRGASFLVLPSYSENFGNVVVEAMGVGCPVVVTEEVGAAEVVREAGGGIVVKGDPATLRGAMLRLAADPEQRRAMGFAGEVYVREHLSWDSVAVTMTRCYRSLLAEATRR
jgi:glycosyltransferase involved in cell wall biosynthesis